MSSNDSLYYVRRYPEEHFFDVEDAWVALEEVFRKELQSRASSYYEQQARLRKMAEGIAEIEKNLAAISARAGVAS